MGTETGFLVTPEIGDQANILASSASAASMPAENAFKIQPTDPWRSTVTNPAFLELDFGSAYEIDFVGVLFGNGSTNGTIRVKLNSTSSFGSPAYDSGAQDYWMNKAQVDYSGWRRIHSYLDLAEITPSIGSAGSQTYRYMRLEINDSTQSWVQVGRIYIGLKFRPTRNILWGSGFPLFSENVIRTESEGGLSHPIPRPKRREVRVTFEFNSESELINNFGEIMRNRGVSRDILFVPFPESTWKQHTMLYGLISAPIRASIPTFEIYRADLELEELV